MASLSPDTASPKYDIYISHSGEDVQKKLVSHLYHRLLPHGLRVSMGKEENQSGGDVKRKRVSRLYHCLHWLLPFYFRVFNGEEELEEVENITPQIEDVIRTATLHITIFCPKYTNSSSCLNELFLMWESGTPIIPVFYHVNPIDILRSGRNARGLPQTDRHTMAKWRDALDRVKQTTGFDLRDYDGDEGQLVSQVVERVLKMLKDNLDYDVFINHRGPDVKKTLASYLYYCLVARGLRVFLDIEEMQEGESLTSQIEGAIRTAFIHIAIFSPTYAESSWCLDELVQMLESGSKIIPIFHTVKPSELTSENGKYAQQLRQLEEKTDQEGKPRYDPATIRKWKTALSEVDKSTEFDLEHYDSDEGQLAEEVMHRVLSEQVNLWRDGVRPRCCAN